MNIKIRKATPSDAPIIAWAVAEAIGIDASKGYVGENYLDVLTEIAGLEETQYSYRNALIAAVDDRPVGAIVSYDGGQLSELRNNTLSIIHKYNPDLVVTDDETEAGEVYIDTIGILPAYRGHGIGTKLLEQARSGAFAAGYKCVGLLVDPENPAAERLYLSLGFKCVGTKLFLGHKMKHMQSYVEV